MQKNKDPIGIICKNLKYAKICKILRSNMQKICKKYAKICTISPTSTAATATAEACPSPASNSVELEIVKNLGFKLVT